MNHPPDSFDGTDRMLARMLALAARLEAEGQMNLSKLVEAAVFGRLHRAAWQSRPASTAATMGADLDAVIDALKHDGLNSHLIGALEAGRRMLAEGQVPLFGDAPDVFVCRVCGHAALGSAPDHCPDCGAWPGGFRKFVGTFNGDNAEPVNPLDVVALLAKNATTLESLVKGLDQDEMNRRPAEDVWAIHHHVAHFRDAQETLEMRVDLMLTQDNPELVTVALYEIASQAAPSPTADLLTDYLNRRARLVARLEALPLKDFWRTGRHQEFGRITIVRQLAYMANHEQTHFPDIETLRRQLLAQR